MSRALIVTDDPKLAREIEIALRARRIDDIEIVPDLRTLAMLVRLASDLVEAQRTLVLLPTRALLREGLESLLRADDLFRSAAEHIVPVVLVCDEHRSERAGMERMSCFTQYIEPPLDARSLSRALAALTPESGRRVEPAAPSGSLFATSARMVPSQTLVPAVERPVPQQLAERRITTELPSLGRSDARDESSALRQLYALYMQGRAGIITLGEGRTGVEALFRDGHIGRRSRGRSPSREQLIAALTRPDAALDFRAMDLPPEHFESYGEVLAFVYDAIKGLSINDVALRLADQGPRYVVYTDLLSQRQQDLSSYEGLLEFCRMCDGSLTWTEVLRRLGAKAANALRWAWFARETDLLMFCDEATRAPLSVRYRGLNTSDALGEEARASTVLRTGVSSGQQAALHTELIHRLEQKLRKLKASDPYESFSLAPGCGVEAVRTAFYSIAKENHPDVYGGNIDPAVKRLTEDVFIEYRQIQQKLLKAERSTNRSRERTSSQMPAVTPPTSEAAWPARPSHENNSSTIPPSGSTTRPPQGERTSGIRPRAHTPPSREATPVPTRAEDRDARSNTPLPPWTRSGSDPSSTQPPVAQPPTSPPVTSSSPDLEKTEAVSSESRRPLPPWVGAGSSSEPRRPGARRVNRSGGGNKVEDPFAEGERLLKLNQFDRAHEAFERAVAAEPENGRKLAWRAWAAHLSEQLTRAEVAVQLAELAQKHNSESDIFLLLGRLAKMEGKDERAFKFFKQALALDARNVDAQREVRLYNLRREEKEEKSQKSSFFGRLFGKDKG